MKNKEMFEVKYEYDADADAIFIKKQIDYKYNISVELNNNVIMDFDKNNQPVALEILNASKVLNVGKFSLKRINSVDLTIVVNKDLICVNGNIVVEVHNKETELFLEPSTTNDLGMPDFTVELATA